MGASGVVDRSSGTPPTAPPVVPPPHWREVEPLSAPPPRVDAPYAEPHHLHHGHMAEVGEELLHEVDVKADDVSTAVVIAWFVMVALLSFAAPVAGRIATHGADGTFVALWLVGVIAAVGGAVPFWRGGHRGMAALGIGVAALVPLAALLAVG